MASLYEYFALRYVADPHTLYQSISAVQPGTLWLVRGDGSESERSFYAFDFPANRGDVDEEAYLDELEGALTEAIRTRLVADVPVGAFLSSGVDSSLVCAIAAQTLGKDLRCFSAGFEGGAENETPVAREIARTLGLRYEEYSVSQNDLLETASRFGEILDEPNGDRSCVPVYFLSHLVRERVTVALSGDGGDELFGGYGRYREYRADPQRSDLDAVLGYFASALPVFPADALHEIFPEEEEAFRQRVASRFVAVFARKDLDDIERLRLVDLHTYLPGAVLAKVDRMSMRHALEVRTPFFSPAILDLSARLPMRLCAQGGLLKVALRRLLARYLPDELIRPGKQGFGMPESFFRAHFHVFERLAAAADDSLSEWQPMRDRPAHFAKLRQAARSNINSLWAWTVLGQWTTTLGQLHRGA